MKNLVQGASDRAVTYLEREKEIIKSDTYLLCLATYALTMARSTKEFKDELRMALDAKAKGEGMI